MSLREIVTWPDKRLEEKAKPITRIDDRLRALVDDMTETMYVADGVGLAANQIGEHVRLIVIDVSAVQPEHGLIKAFNPEIVESDGEAVHEEGCLSLPDVREDVTRPATVRVRYLDPDGKAHDLRVEGLLARVFQHEIDHLDGKLLFDRLSALKRGLIKRRLRKAKIAAEEEKAAAAAERKKKKHPPPRMSAE